MTHNGLMMNDPLEISVALIRNHTSNSGQGYYSLCVNSRGPVRATCHMPHPELHAKSGPGLAPMISGGPLR